jgi:hypothetical protein
LNVPVHVVPAQSAGAIALHSVGLFPKNWTKVASRCAVGTQAKTLSHATSSCCWQNSTGVVGAGVLLPPPQARGRRTNATNPRPTIFIMGRMVAAIGVVVNWMRRA